MLASFTGPAGGPGGVGAQLARIRLSPARYLSLALEVELTCAICVRPCLREATGRHGLA